jgi:hypothetical protein
MCPMSMKSTVILAILTLVALGCDDNDSTFNSDEEFAVTVVNSHDFTTCGLPLINFTEKLEKIRELTGGEETTFNAFLLKEEFHVDGLKLKIKVRKTRDDELLPCLTWGIAWPWVTVLNARIVN